LAPTRRSTRSSEGAPDAEAATPDEATPAGPAGPAEPAPKPKRRSTRPTKASAADPTPAAAESGPDAIADTDAATPRRRRIVLTGAAGLVGRSVARALLDRGDELVALVRDPERVRWLADEGAEVLADDLSDVARLTDRLRDADAAIHAAGSYRIGIRREERGALWDANVGTTTRMLDAAAAAGIPRLVYVSTVNAFGNTHGRVVDETYRRDLREGFVSWYDETKYGAHEVAEQRIRDGQPVVIVMPSQVYGRGDHSGFGDQVARAHAGRLRYRALDDVGVGLVHADDLAAGIVAAVDRGRIGESYVLSGPRTTLRGAIELAAAVGGRRAPFLRVPTTLLRLSVPLGGLIGQPNLREVISAAAGVTYWASAEKAEGELGFRARDLETGFRDVFGSR
jgi:nucleoside-diphosphate-sugar epimerase